MLPAEGFSLVLEEMERASDVRYQDEVVTHEIRVGEHSAEFGRLMGLNAVEQRELRLAGRFHDIGKMKVPLAILLKPGRLDSDERTLMQCHTTFGVDTLQLCGHPVPSFLIDAVRYHHERWDGHGYEGLTGHAIPRIARIICLTDVHDAMTADRPYRSGMPEGTALGIMIDTERNDGAVFFDPDLLRNFVAWRCLQARDLTASQRRQLIAFSESPVPPHARVTPPESPRLAVVARTAARPDQPAPQSSGL